MCGEVAKNKGVKVLPLQTQGEFLLSMGIVNRVEQLIDKDETSDDMAEVLVDSFQKLVDPAEMGSRFKVLTITDPKLDLEWNKKF